MFTKINLNLIRAITTSSYRLNNLQTAIAADPVDTNNGVKFKKLQLSDKELTETLLTIKSKKQKQKHQKIIVEGNLLIKEALKSHLKPDKFIFSDIRKFNEFYKEITRVVGKDVASSIENLRVPESDLTFYSTLTTCPGIIGIFDKPQTVQQKENALPITVISDGCKEPNNVGALIRVANCLPIKKLLLPKGNVDIWDTKSIRGSSGSVFHLPTKTQLSWEEINEEIGSNDLILIADNNINRYSGSQVVNYDQIPDELLLNNICVIIGGETQGISKEALKLAKNRTWRVVNIPIDETGNSLNISNALAIILFELRRKLTLV